MNYYLIVTLFVIVIVLMLLKNRKTIEKFTMVEAEWLRLLASKPPEETRLINAPEMIRKPLTIYYTKHIDQCNSPGVYYINDKKDETYRINFGFHVEYYRELYKHLREQFYGVNTSPTPEENALLVGVQDIIEQYDRFVDDQKQACKYTIPNWYHFAPKSENLLLGEIQDNKTRGLSKHWALIGQTKDKDIQTLEGITQLKMRTEPHEGYYIKVDGSNDEHNLYSLDSYSKETVKNLYCTPNQSFQLRFGLVIEPRTLNTAFIMNGTKTESYNLSDEDVKYVLKLLNLAMSISGTDDEYQALINTSNKIETQVVRLQKNICDTVSRELSPIRCTVTFKDTSALRYIYQCMFVTTLLRQYIPKAQAFIQSLIRYYNEHRSNEYNKLLNTYNELVKHVLRMQHYSSEIGIYIQIWWWGLIEAERFAQFYIDEADKGIVSKARSLLESSNLHIDMISQTLVPEYLRYLSYDGNLYIPFE